MPEAPSGTEFDPDLCQELYKVIANASGARPDEVEVHIETTQYKLLGWDGKLRDHTVHGFVEWYGNRSLDAKKIIAFAVHNFLHLHGLGKGSDITFRDSPSETFFVEGKLVPGGPPRK